MLICGVKQAFTPVCVCFVIGFIWAEIKEMWDGGFNEYVHDWWNLMDFAMNSLYLATISLKIVAYVKVSFYQLKVINVHMWMCTGAHACTQMSDCMSICDCVSQPVWKGCQIRWGGCNSMYVHYLYMHIYEMNWLGCPYLMFVCASFGQFFKHALHVCVKCV